MKMYGENFGFNKFNKKLMLSIFSIYIFFFVIFLSVAFSAFEVELVMKDITAEIKFMPDDARVIGFASTTPNNGGIASNTDYNYNRVYGDITLPNSDSSVVYEVQVTNLGNAKVGISSITGLGDNLEYTLTGYEVGGKIQDENGQYKLGTVMTFYITIHYAEGATPTNTLQSFNLLLEFRQFHSITYHGVPGEEAHPTEIMEGYDLVINTELTSIDRMKITQDTVFLTYGEHYIYDENNNILTVKNVSGDLLISYRDVSYLISLYSDNSFYKEAAFRTSIKTIDFVDYIDTTNAVKTYDLSENKDSSIIGWIMSNGDGTYKLYIGSIYDIYARNMGKAFYKMTGLQTINFKNLNTSESTSFAYTFYETKVTSLDLSTFNTASATSMLDMFGGMNKLKTLDVSNFNTSKVENMYYMFGGLSELIELDISTFDTSSVKNMGYMFSGMSKLTTLRLGQNFNTTQVTDMQYMFMGMSSIQSLDLSTFKTNNVKSMRYMFHNCDSITSLNLSHFNTEKVENMSYMFYNMDKLSNLNISNFNTSSVLVFDGMFDTCTQLANLDLRHFNTQNAVSMANMFNNMFSLKTLDISSFVMTGVSNLSNFLSNCTTIEQIDMRSASFDYVSTYSNMFYGISNNVIITAKDSAAQTWLQAQLGGKGTVIIPEIPEEETGGETEPEEGTETTS